jgi:hypothetical protein
LHEGVKCSQATCERSQSEPGSHAAAPGAHAPVALQYVATGEPKGDGHASPHFFPSHGPANGAGGGGVVVESAGAGADADGAEVASAAPTDPFGSVDDEHATSETTMAAAKSDWCMAFFSSWIVHRARRRTRP